MLTGCVRKLSMSYDRLPTNDPELMKENERLNTIMAIFLGAWIGFIIIGVFIYVTG